MSYMPEQPSIRRYSIIDPDSGAPLEEEGPKGHVQKTVRGLTWAILGVCLALWAVVGFLFWVPLLLRSMLEFTLALIQSMLQGARPVQAGRILRDTVDFYRRGFLVAIEAVFGKLPEPERSQHPMSGSRVVMEIGWALLVWYAVLLMAGVVETTPADLWRGAAEYPWGETLGGLLGSATEALRVAPVDSLAPAVSGAAADSLTP
jgi:hypothetical protein